MKRVRGHHHAEGMRTVSQRNLAALLWRLAK